MSMMTVIAKAGMGKKKLTVEEAAKQIEARERVKAALTGKSTLEGKVWRMVIDRAAHFMAGVINGESVPESIKLSGYLREEGGTESRGYVSLSLRSDRNTSHGALFAVVKKLGFAVPVKAGDKMPAQDIPYDLLVTAGTIAEDQDVTVGKNGMFFSKQLLLPGDLTKAMACVKWTRKTNDVRVEHTSDEVAGLADAWLAQVEEL